MQLDKCAITEGIRWGQILFQGTVGINMLCKGLNAPVSQCIGLNTPVSQCI